MSKSLSQAGTGTRAVCPLRLCSDHCTGPRSAQNGAWDAPPAATLPGSCSGSLNLTPTEMDGEQGGAHAGAERRQQAATSGPPPWGMTTGPPPWAISHRWTAMRPCGAFQVPVLWPVLCCPHRPLTLTLAGQCPNPGQELPCPQASLSGPHSDQLGVVGIRGGRDWHHADIILKCAGTPVLLSLSRRGCPRGVDQAPGRGPEGGPPAVC